MARSSTNLIFRTLVILTVMGFFLLLFIILKFGLTPKLKLDSESICQTFASQEMKRNSDALEHFRDVAEYCVDREKHEEAVEILAQVYKVESLLFGATTKQAVETLETLAGQYVILEKYDQGLALYWRVYKVKEQFLGPVHSETLSTLQLLAHVYHFLGKYEKAAEFAKVVYKQRKILLGPEHTSTMESLLLLASSLEKTNQSPETIEKVLKYYKKVYKVYSGIWCQNEEALSVRLAMGKFLLSLKRFEEAVPIFERIIEAMEKRPQSELYEEAENMLSLALRQLNRTQEARLVHIKARRNKNKKGKKIPEYDSKVVAGGKFTLEVEDQINSVLNLAKVAMAEGNYENALEKLEQLYSIIENEHPKTQEILQAITNVYGALGNVTKAFEMSIQLFSVVQSKSGSGQKQKVSIASAWDSAFNQFLLILEKHPKLDPEEEILIPKFLKMANSVVNHLAMEFRYFKEDDDGNFQVEENPGVLKALAMAAFVAEEQEIAKSAAAKLVRILERQKEWKSNGKSKRSEIDKEMKIFQKMLSDKKLWRDEKSQNKNEIL